MEKSKLTAEDKAALTIEIEAMKRLSDHDAFVKLYEFFDEETKYMLVIELISGGELFDRIVEKEKYSEREARRVIRQLTEAMADAHSKGIAHRDLKPGAYMREKSSAREEAQRGAGVGRARREAPRRAAPLPALLPAPRIS